VSLIIIAITSSWHGRKVFPSIRAPYLRSRSIRAPLYRGFFLFAVFRFFSLVFFLLLCLLSCSRCLVSFVTFFFTSWLRPAAASSRSLLSSFTRRSLCLFFCPSRVSIVALVCLLYPSFVCPFSSGIFLHLTPPVLAGLLPRLWCRCSFSWLGVASFAVSRGLSVAFWSVPAPWYECLFGRRFAAPPQAALPLPRRRRLGSPVLHVACFFPCSVLSFDAPRRGAHPGFAALGRYLALLHFFQQ